MAEAVYLLCALTSLTCGLLLLRGYCRTPQRLLLWSGLCFCGLALSNGLLFVDLAVWRDVNLTMLRNITALVATALLLFGLVWETD